MLGNMKNEAKVKTSDPGTLNEQALKEAVEALGMGLKSELLDLFEEDRHMKNIRF